MEGETAVRDFLLGVREEGGLHVAEDDGDAARWEKRCRGGFGADAGALLQPLTGFDVVEDLAGGCAEVGPLVGAVAVGLRGGIVRLWIGDAVRAWPFHALATVAEGRA